MAKIQRNVIIEGMSGLVGKSLVFRQMKDGRTIVSAKPDFSNRMFSKEQLTHQSRFQEASSYARQAAKTNPIYAELAKGTSKTAYNLALSDWFNAPVIHSIQRENGRMLIEATDNILVSKVVITIVGEEGHIREQGQAVQINESLWEYATTQTGNMIVEAFDLPGNRTSREI